jgi:phage shock protein PspC (stress-responsive transcriptional regulator)
MTYKKLTRSKTNRKIAGVCGGLGDYLNIDPTVMRVLFILLILFAGSGLLLYLILMFVIPDEC